MKSNEKENDKTLQRKIAGLMEKYAPLLNR